MKAIKIPAVVLILLLLAALLDGFLLTKQCAAWTDELDVLEAAALDAAWSQAQNAFDTLRQDWSGWEGGLHVLIDHSEIDRAGELFSLCELYLSEKDTAALRVAVSQLRSLFALLAETEQLNIKNVL